MASEEVTSAVDPRLSPRSGSCPVERPLRLRWEVTPSADRLPVRSVSRTEARRLRLKPGDLVLEKSGGGEHVLVGLAVPFDLDIDAVPTNFAARVRPTARVVPGYLALVFGTLYDLGLTARAIKPTTGMQNLDVREVLSSPWAVPPAEEQARVVQAVRGHESRSGALLSQLTRQIELLRERRQALITAAVTRELVVT